MSSISTVRSSALPPESQLGAFLKRVDYTDSFALSTNSGSLSILEIYTTILGHLPDAFKHLIVLRSQFVRPMGIRGVSYDELARSIDTTRTYSAGDRIGRWTLFAETRDELVAGADDKHLDFRVSILRERRATGERVIFSTGVQTHNLLGRVYLAVILPFHRFGVAKLLTRAAQAHRLDAPEER